MSTKCKCTGNLSGPQNSIVLAWNVFDRQSNLIAKWIFAPPLLLLSQNGDNHNYFLYHRPIIFADYDNASILSAYIKCDRVHSKLSGKTCNMKRINFIDVSMTIIWNDVPLDAIEWIAAGVVNVSRKTIDFLIGLHHKTTQKKEANQHNKQFDR